MLILCPSWQGEERKQANKDSGEEGGEVVSMDFSSLFCYIEKNC